MKNNFDKFGRYGLEHRCRSRRNRLFDKNRPTAHRSGGVNPYSDSGVQMPPDAQARMLVKEAFDSWVKDDWENCETSATDAIDLDPDNQPAHYCRAQARRFQGDYDGAIEDFTKAVGFDPENADTFMYRGAAWMDKASFSEDYSQAVSMMMDNAFVDFNRAADIDPGSVSVGLSILEAELCCMRYRQAVATSGTCWVRADLASRRLVCAWLGAMSIVLAGRPERKWQHYREYLEEETASVGGYWNARTVNRFVKHLEESGCEDEKLKALHIIHNLYLAHS